MKKLWALRFVFALLALCGAGAVILFQLWTHYSTGMIVAAITLVCACLLLSWWSKRRDERRGWRIRPKTREVCDWAYEEKSPAGWRILPFDELGDPSMVPHVLQLPREFPDWAAERRGEIVSRLKSELRPPYYVLIEDA